MYSHRPIQYVQHLDISSSVAVILTYFVHLEFCILKLLPGQPKADIEHQVTSQDPTSKLLGSNQQDYFSIVRWMSFANSSLLPAIGGIILPVIRQPIEVHMDDQDCLRILRRDCKTLEDHLQKSKYLVGDQLTLADLFTVGLLFGAYMLLHKTLTAEYPRLTEWFNEVYTMPMIESVAGPLHKLDIPVPALLKSEG